MNLLPTEHPGWWRLARAPCAGIGHRLAPVHPKQTALCPPLLAVGLSSLARRYPCEPLTFLPLARPLLRATCYVCVPCAVCRRALGRRLVGCWSAARMRPAGSRVVALGALCEC
eukprot:scaffold11257_cov133-Isochrysis_galbana.AAC.4